jgi:hypothetical protein
MKQSLLERGASDLVNRKVIDYSSCTAAGRVETQQVSTPGSLRPLGYALDWSFWYFLRAISKRVRVKKVEVRLFLKK